MNKTKTALITGASRGLGFALAEELALKGWQLLIDGRSAGDLLKARQWLTNLTDVIAVAGDVCDEVHLIELGEILERNHWSLDLVVNNASTLGLSPLRPLLEYPVENLHRVIHTNMIAPVSLVQKIRPFLKPDARIVNVSSDAGKEIYENWGAYGGSKAGLEHLTATLAKENPDFLIYAFDPGDMRTDMHQLAYPGEDISDRPLPGEHAVPALLQLIEGNFPSGRYTISSLKQVAA